MARRYSPAGRFSIWYLPALSESTLTVIFVLALRAWTKAPRNAAPSGPVTEPLMLAASATVLERANEARVASARFAAGHVAFPDVCCAGASFRKLRRNKHEETPCARQRNSRSQLSPRL